MVEGVPYLEISERAMDILQKPLEFTMITKLLSKEVGYMTLLDRIKMMWKPKGKFFLIDQEHGYYIVKFSREDDFLTAIIDSPWSLFRSYLAIQRWDPDFYPTKGLPMKTVVWVRIPNLPLHLYQETLLMEIENIIGTHIKIDLHTISRQHRKFMRLAVEIRTDRALIPILRINSKCYRVEYENVPYICMECSC